MPTVQGLLPPLFRQLNAHHIPVASTWITGIGTALIAFFISLEILAEAISIGTLFAFSIVDAGVVVMRYVHSTRLVVVAVTYPSHSRVPPGSNRRSVRGRRCASYLPSPWPASCAVCRSMRCSAQQLCALCCGSRANWCCPSQHWSVIITCAFGAIALALLAALYMQPVASVPATFRCPLVPLVPCAGITINMFMMSGLSLGSWIRLLAWTVIGVAIYLAYGVFHSTLNHAPGGGRSVGHADPEGVTVDDSERATLLSPGGGDAIHMSLPRARASSTGRSQN